MFGVKTRCIIGQKSQNSARYAGAFWGEKSLFLGGLYQNHPSISTYILYIIEKIPQIYGIMMPNNLVNSTQKNNDIPS